MNENSTNIWRNGGIKHVTTLTNDTNLPSSKSQDNYSQEGSTHNN